MVLPLRQHIVNTTYLFLRGYPFSNRGTPSLPLFTELPRREIPGNPVSDKRASRKLRRHRRRIAQTSRVRPLVQGSGTGRV